MLKSSFDPRDPKSTPPREDRATERPDQTTPMFVRLASDPNPKSP